VAPSRHVAIDNIFAALADPTRLSIIERLMAKGELAVGDLSEPYRISAPAISRHLNILERAGLIERRIDKQRRIMRVKREAFRPVESWLAHQRRHWNDALDRMEAVIAAQTAKERKS
jgi:DNA-binding transcriptional ArsR family regulator